MPADSEEAAPTDSDRGYERGIVTFIDILGFRALLKTRHVSDIVKVVKALRAFTAGDADDDEPPVRMDEVRLYTQSFSESVSDAVVRVRTIDTQSPDGPFVRELIDLMHASIECVNMGILVRGGLTIGPVHVGLDGKGPIFGDAMVRAYEIEENEAVYPRIMIDEDAINAYLADKSLWQDGELDSDEVEIAERVIGVTEDGSYFVDYLNAAGPGDFDEGVAGQFEFLRRHREVIVGGLAKADAKARRKLVWLANYHNRFIAKLRDQYDMADPHSAFETETGIAPTELFDALVIDGNWSRMGARLSKIAGSEAGSPG